MSGSVQAVAAEIRSRQSFILTSHARPDGDAIGSSVALALALEHLGKTVTVVLEGPIPRQYLAFPAVDRIVFTTRVDQPADAVILLECSDITRPNVAGLADYFVINIDHHLGNQSYGQVNWFDSTAAACGELVAELVDELAVPWTRDIAAHLYLAISTDTGGFRYGPITARTFDLCRRIAETGVETSALSRQIFDSFSIGRVKLTGAMLNAMELHHDDRLAVLTFDDALLARSGAAIDDTEGLVNLPLGAREVLAVALLRRQDASTFRVSLRSKGDVDVRRVAERWHGGGHHNAAGCTVSGRFDEVRDSVVAAMGAALDASTAAHR